MSQASENISTSRTARILAAALGLGVLVGLGGCRNDMHDQARAEVGEASEFFEDGKVNREQPVGTIAVSQNERHNPHLYTGKINGQLAATFPFPIGITELKRGQQRYNIYCSVCHGADGTSNGMIVQRGFVKPPNIVDDPRLRSSPPGHFYEVIANGWGAMYSYNDRISVEDRWKIAAYVQVLQTSQVTDLSQLPEEDQGKVHGAKKLAELIRIDEQKSHSEHGEAHEGSHSTEHSAPAHGKGGGHE